MTISFVLMLIGIILIQESVTEVEYPINDYWIAKGCHHVYDIDSGEIVDMISENERVSLEGKIITVATTDRAMEGWGIALSFIFGTIGIGILVPTIGDSEWWERFKSTFG